MVTYCRTFLSVILALMLVLAAAVPSSYAGPRSIRKRPSKTKNIAVGTAIGAVAGALIGGRKGALIGAGAGAGSGYVYYRHKKKKYNNRYVRRY